MHFGAGSGAPTNVDRRETLMNRNARKRKRNAKLRLRATLEFATFEPPLLCSGHWTFATEKRFSRPSPLTLELQTPTVPDRAARQLYMRASCSRSAARSSGRGARARTHPEQSIGHRAEASRAREAAPRPSCRAGLTLIRAAGAANSTPHAPPASLYGERDEPWKMTYSRMAFFSRPCVLANLPASATHAPHTPESRVPTARQH